MASRPASDSTETAFLVERYLPPGEALGLARSVTRVAALASRRAGRDVQYLHSAYLPTEETCFCLFRASSIEAVRELNREGLFALDRITEAVLLHPSNSRINTSGDPS